jgi:hypothetical protein
MASFGLKCPGSLAEQGLERQGEAWNSTNRQVQQLVCLQLGFVETLQFSVFGRSKKSALLREKQQGAWSHAR